MAKQQEKEELGRFEVIVFAFVGLIFASYCVFEILKAPSITTMLDEVRAKHGQNHDAPNSAPGKGR